MGRTLKNMLIGAGRLFDFSGSYGRASAQRMKRRHDALRSRSDSDALASDWAKIGADMRKTLEKAESVYGQR